MDHYLGLAADVPEKGPATFFRVIKDGQIYPGFVTRVNDQVKAYLNVCAHVGLRLNGEKNNLFSRDGNYLYCHAHGAIYEPDTGLCLQGPCKGLSLISLRLKEINGKLFLDDEVYEFYEPL